MSIIDELSKAYEPTEEDIAREVTVEELKLLSSRTRCRVDMWKWNPVNDLAQSLHEAGRFEGKSRRFIHKLLVKAYHRKRAICEQYRERMAEQWLEDWRYRKKENLLRLKLWEYQEENDTSIEDDVMVEDMVEDEVVHETSRLDDTVSSLEVQGSPVRWKTRSASKRQNIVPDTTEVTINSPNDASKKNNRVPDMTEISVDANDDVSVIKDLMVINSESISSQSLFLSPSVEVEEFNKPFPMSSLELLEAIVQPVPDSQSQGYEAFHNSIPVSSTQDAVS